MCRTGLPWWSDFACQYREHGFNPWSGKTPHAVGQLSPCTATAEPAHPRARTPREVHVPQLQGSPCLPQLEEAHSEQRRPSAAKKEGNFKKYVGYFLCPTHLIFLATFYSNHYCNNHLSSGITHSFSFLFWHFSGACGNLTDPPVYQP